MVKTATIVHYTIDPAFFEKHDEIERSYTTQSNWLRAEHETYILMYGVSYRV